MSVFRTLELAEEFYQTSKNIRLPAHLREQFLKACSSVALNLAEGNAKMSNKEKLRFYEIAHGSFRESVTILEIEQIKNVEVLKIADRLGGSLFKLTRALAAKDVPSQKV